MGAVEWLRKALAPPSERRERAAGPHRPSGRTAFSNAGLLSERRRDYLGRLVARMDAMGFPEEDAVRVAAVGARDAVEGILTALDPAEPPAPFLAHYGPSAPIERPGTPDAGTAHLPWVGKRKARRRK